MSVRMFTYHCAMLAITEWPILVVLEEGVPDQLEQKTKELP